MAYSPPQRQVGSGFVNLQRYLGANKPGQLESTVAGGLKKDVEKTGQESQSNLQSFQSDVNKGSIGSDADKQRRQSLLDKAQSGGVMSPEEVSEFERLRSGSYGGPQDLGAKGQQTQLKAQETANLGKSIGQEGGRLNLLQSYVGGGKQYGSGAQKFDELLLGGSKGDQLRQAQKAALQGLRQANQTQNLAQSLAGQAKGQTQAFTGDTKQQLGLDESGTYQQGQGALGGLLKNISQGQGDLSEKARSLTASIKYKLAHSYDPKAALTPEERELVFGTKNPVQTFGTDLNSLVNQVGQYSAPTLGQSATAQQKASLAALSQLAGTDRSQFGVGDEETTGVNQLVNVNKPAFQNAIQGQQQKYQQELATPQGFNYEAAQFLPGFTGGYGGATPVSTSDLNSYLQSLQQNLSRFAPGSAGHNYIQQESQRAQQVLNKINQKYNIGTTY